MKSSQTGFRPVIKQNIDLINSEIRTSKKLSTIVKELYILIKEKEAISSHDLDYWNYRINYGINNKLFNNDFGRSFYNAIVLSKNNKVFARKLKKFFSTNLFKFSKERRILIIKKFKE